VADDDSGSLSELLMHAARAQRRRWRELLEPWELTPSQARALRVIGDGDGTRVSDLAEALRIAPRSATEVADSLEARGLAERTADPSDRRAVLLRATDAGRAIRAEVDVARAADARALFGRLSADDRATLARVLRELAERD
jgi:DNA-binding MarR family transcriptional regulator